jgi:hypothetical protein
VPYRLNFSDGTDTTFLLYQDANVNSYQLTLNKTVEFIELDPEQWVLHRLNSLSVGLEEQNSHVHFTLGPNPSHGPFSIFLTQMPVKDLSVCVTDLSGRAIYKAYVDHSSRRVDISGIPAGMYLVAVTDGANNLVKKLIIE